MRILHINKYYHDKDGAGRYMFDLMRLQKQSGHQVAPFAMHDKRNAPTPWDKYFVSSLDTSHVGSGLHLIDQITRAAWSVQARNKLELMLDEFKPDIVHAHNIYTHLSPSVLAVCKKRGIPVVMTVHDYALVSANYSLWNEDKTNLSPTASWLTVARSKFIKNSWSATLVLDFIYRVHKFLRLYDRAIDTYLVSSKFVKNTLVSAGYKADKITIEPLFASNLIEYHRLRKTVATHKEGVLFAGRLVDYKGVDMLVAAAAKLPQVNFYVAGTGPMQSWLKDQARKFKNLKLLGFLGGEELWKAMASAELVIVPSRWAETYALVTVEAMACGTAVLVSDAGGLAEKIIPGETGYVFQAGNEADMIKTLKMALKRPEKLAKMGQAAKTWAKMHANPWHHVEAIEKIYSDVLVHRS